MSFKSFRPYSSRKSANETDRWDHGGFEQLQREERSQKNVDYLNCRKKYPSYEHTSDKTLVSQKSTSGTSNTYQGAVIAQEVLTSENNAKNYREKKRPDRALYKPPKQRDHQKEFNLQRNSSTVSETQKSDQAEQMDFFLNMESKNLTDTTETQDEERFSISSESTNNSDKTQGEEMVLSKLEQRNSSILSTTDISPHEKFAFSQPLFELTVRLYDGTIAEFKLFDSAEDDYETLIDQFCTLYQIEEEDCLPIKIQIVKYMLCEKALTTAKLSALFEKLLETNYQLLIKENHSASEF